MAKKSKTKFYEIQRTYMKKGVRMVELLNLKTHKTIYRAERTAIMWSKRPEFDIGKAANEYNVKRDIRNINSRLRQYMKQLPDTEDLERLKARIRGAVTGTNVTKKGYISLSKESVKSITQKIKSGGYRKAFEILTETLTPTQISKKSGTNLNSYRKEKQDNFRFKALVDDFFEWFYKEKSLNHYIESRWEQLYFNLKFKQTGEQYNPWEREAKDFISELDAWVQAGGVNISNGVNKSV